MSARICRRISLCNADLTRTDLTRPDPSFHLQLRVQKVIHVDQLQTARRELGEKPIDRLLWSDASRRPPLPRRHDTEEPA